ncbi:MAG: flagellar motor protein MotB [Henriciella sp.]|uniref:flagellar motor protein MotB n=1 Tax=Henriciella sp. TaxID=1968823 RepID=UPI003C707B42
MAEKPEPEQNITIIKRKKVVKADGHHGGAWKVAYADFVTAMMAFFLLMWLLNATTEEQRKGIADYFNPTIPVSRISGGGSDGLNGSSLYTEETYAQMGTGATRKKSVAPNDAADSRQIAQGLNDLREELSKDPRKLSEHLLVKMTAEGIVLEIIDSESRPLFELGQSQPTPLLIKLLELISGSLNTFDNDIKIVGHTDNRPYRGNRGYDNWNLSADRANTARKLLLSDGLPIARLKEVSGRADTDPLIEDNPAAAQNRRISITIVTSANQPTPEGLSAY